MSISDIDAFEMGLGGYTLGQDVRGFFYLLMDLRLMAWDPLFEDDGNRILLGATLIAAIKEDLL